jgi:7-cyano-7-deazaguanine synthase in queuosine biosynthesis
MQPRHVRTNVRFDKNDFAHPMAEESTTRGRSFLFLALAALAASGLSGKPVIYVPENGLISVNVPLDPLRVGALSTRTTHPFYIARWHEMLAGLGIPAKLENPYRFKTKGEMLTGCANAGLALRHLVDTISCSSITKARWLGLAPRHCGFCVPCLIRRAAITSASRTDPTTYTIADLVARPLNSKSAEGEQVRSFQVMARRLERRPALAKILVHKSGPLSDYADADVAAYAEVFRRGIQEVDAVTGPVTVHPA